MCGSFSRWISFPAPASSPSPPLGRRVFARPRISSWPLVVVLVGGTHVLRATVSQFARYIIEVRKHPVVAPPAPSRPRLERICSPRYTPCGDILHAGSVWLHPPFNLAHNGLNARTLALVLVPRAPIDLCPRCVFVNCALCLVSQVLPRPVYDGQRGGGNIFLWTAQTLYVLL